MTTTPFILHYGLLASDDAKRGKLPEEVTIVMLICERPSLSRGGSSWFVVTLASPFWNAGSIQSVALGSLTTAWRLIPEEA